MKEILKEFLEQSQYWGFVFSVGAYLSACWLKEKTRLALLNPLLVSAAVIIVFFWEQAWIMRSTVKVHPVWAGF